MIPVHRTLSNKRYQVADNILVKISSDLLSVEVALNSKSRALTDEEANALVAIGRISNEIAYIRDLFESNEPFLPLAQQNQSTQT